MIINLVKKPTNAKAFPWVLNHKSEAHDYMQAVYQLSRLKVRFYAGSNQYHHFRPIVVIYDGRRALIDFSTISTVL